MSMNLTIKGTGKLLIGQITAFWLYSTLTITKMLPMGFPLKSAWKLQLVQNVAADVTQCKLQIPYEAARIEGLVLLNRFLSGHNLKFKC